MPIEKPFQGFTGMDSTNKAKWWICLAATAFVLVSCAGAPKRPGTVPPDAVFVPVVSAGSGVPRARRGDWLSCWVDQESDRNRCRLSKQDGTLEYDGTFLRYEAAGVAPVGGTRTDIAASGASVQWLHFGERVLPAIHLKDGSTLLPAEAYGDDPLHEDE